MKKKNIVKKNIIEKMTKEGKDLLYKELEKIEVERSLLYLLPQEEQILDLQVQATFKVLLHSGHLKI